MEMPEGWKNIQKQIDAYPKWDEPKVFAKLNVAKLIMNEMAEALQKLTDYCDCHSDKEIKVYGCKEGTEALRKFKSWK